MSGPALSQNVPVPPKVVDALAQDRSRSALLVGGTIAAMLVGTLGIGWMLHVFISRDLMHAVLCLQTLLAGVAVGFSSWTVLRQWRRWSRPARELEMLIPGARLGEIPIEELSHVGGGMSSLVPHIQELLRDLRTERCAVSRLNEEIRQRVAVRTESLERTIGTLRQQATRDKLTGLYNRRMFDESLDAIVDRCRAEGEELSLLIGDVDNFKLLNDTLGHAEGDKFLREIAQLIRSTIRPEDMGFRLGGDEFVILLPRGARRPAEELAQRLMSLVDQLARPLKLERRPGLSIGIASLGSLPDPTGPNLLRVADEALYEQKSSRRRRSTDVQAESPIANGPLPIGRGTR